MRITISQPTVIFLYGQSACAQFVGILDYWRKAVDSRDWQNVYFVLVAPEQCLNRRMADPGGDFIRFFNTIQTRCVQLPCGEDGQFRCTPGILTAIQRMFHAGQHLYLQMVVSDLGEPSVNADAIVQAAADIRDHLRVGGLNCLYYMLVNDSASGRRSQRLLAERVKEDSNNSSIYLISSKVASGGLAEPYELWRAVTCELMVSLTRAFENNRLYSLGYTSLNANGSELQRLRQSKLKEIVFTKAWEPMSKAVAWNALFSAVPDRQKKSFEGVSVFEKTSLAYVIKGWLEEEAKTALFLLTPQQKANFRILADLNQAKDFGAFQASVREAVKALYHHNLQASSKSAMMRQVTDVLRNGFFALLRQPNAAQFPLELMDQIDDALDDLISQLLLTVRNLDRGMGSPFPAMSWVSRHFRMDDYVRQCCDIAEADERQNTICKLMGSAATALKGLLANIRKVLANLSRSNELSDLFRTLDEEMELYSLHLLETKYPNYMQNLQTTLTTSTSLFNDQWVQGFAPFYDKAGRLLTDQFRKMINEGEKRLRDRMDSRFSGTFINALRQEMPTVQAMDHFVNGYMGEAPRMHFYIHDTSGVPVERYFVDDELQSQSWIKAHNDKTFLVDNDNIEKLNWYSLGKTLEEYLADESRDNQVFGTYEETLSGGVQPAGMGGETSVEFEPIQLSDPAEEAIRPVREAEAKEPNPRGIQVYERDGRFYLSWFWEDGLTGVSIRLGNTTLPCDTRIYNIKNGLDVTDVLQPGKNHVTIYRPGGTIYGEQDVCGKQQAARYAVQFRGRACNLKVRGMAPGCTDLTAVETVGEKVLYYPLRNNRNSQEIIFEGLITAGRITLENTPDKPFPLVRPKADPTLA